MVWLSCCVLVPRLEWLKLFSKQCCLLEQMCVDAKSLIKEESLVMRCRGERRETRSEDNGSRLPQESCGTF